jgi:AcrR family transcriptional regulator
MSSNETRDRLLASARSTIRSRGFGEASVEDIARAAGLTKGAVYSQFGSKRDLLLGLIDAWASESKRRLLESRRRPFVAVVDFVLFVNRTAWRDLVPEFWRQAVDDALVQKHLSKIYDDLEETIAAVIRSWRFPEDAALAAKRAIQLHDGVAVMAALRDPALHELTRAQVARLLFETHTAITSEQRRASTA